MICFCYFCQKNFQGMAHNDPYSVQIGPKKTIFKRFYQHFFRTAGLHHKLLRLIESPNMFHWKWKSARKSKVVLVFGAKFGANQSNVVKKNKETGISMGVSLYILHEVYICKQEVVVIEIPEWKWKAKLARDIILEGNQDEVFTLVSL